MSVTRLLAGPDQHTMGWLYGSLPPVQQVVNLGQHNDFILV